MDYHGLTLRMIDREIRNVREVKKGQIIAKMNSLVDPTVIEALYSIEMTMAQHPGFFGLPADPSVATATRPVTA